MDPKIWTPLGIVILLLVFLIGGRVGSSIAAKIPVINMIPNS